MAPGPHRRPSGSAPPPAEVGAILSRAPNQELIHALATRHARQFIAAGRLGHRLSLAEEVRVQELTSIRDSMSPADWRAFLAVYEAMADRVAEEVRAEVDAIDATREIQLVRALIIGAVALIVAFKAALWVADGGLERLIAALSSQV